MNEVDLRNKYYIDKLCEIQDYINKKGLYYQETSDVDTYIKGMIKGMCGNFTLKKSTIYIDLDTIKAYEWS